MNGFSESSGKTRGIQPRHWLLLAGLLLTLLLTVLIGSEDEPVESSRLAGDLVLPVNRSVTSVRQALHAPSPAPLQRLPRSALAAEVTDLFQSIHTQSAQQAAAQQAAAQAAKEKPLPPEIPFTVLGLVQESGMDRLIINFNDEIEVLKQGEILHAQYRWISQRKLGKQTELVFTYLPMNLQQTVTIANE